jgi:hypothetical protein
MANRAALIEKRFNLPLVINGSGRDVHRHRRERFRGASGKEQGQHESWQASNLHEQSTSGKKFCIRQRIFTAADCLFSKHGLTSPHGLWKGNQAFQKPSGATKPRQ